MVIEILKQKFRQLGGRESVFADTAYGVDFVLRQFHVVEFLDKLDHHGTIAPAEFAHDVYAPRPNKRLVQFPRVVRGHDDNAAGRLQNAVEDVQ